MLYGQVNLVPNGSFENYTLCPQNENELSKCIGWWKANLATTDYVNACAPILMGGGVNVPYYFMGYQNAYHGNAYVGIGSYYYNGNADAEYAQCSLNFPLKCGYEYVLRAYISLANHSEYTVNNFGILVSKLQPYAPWQYTVFTHQPQLVVNPPVTDTLGWTKIETKFYARGDEQFLTIGRFDYAGQGVFTPFAGDTTNPLINNLTYYLVDSVSLIETGEIINCNAPNVFTPNGDGINDLYTVFDLSDGDRIKIYNRWGTQVYESTGIKDGWDGRTTSGEQCSEGVYYYIIERKEKENRKGYIQLLR